MEHSDIEDAFNRVSPANLQLVLGNVDKSEGEEGYHDRDFRIVLEFLLRNDSRISACAPYVWIDACEGAAVNPALSKVLTFGLFNGRKVFSATHRRLCTLDLTCQHSACASNSSTIVG
jgi:hypothetical protein